MFLDPCSSEQGFSVFKGNELKLTLDRTKPLTLSRPALVLGLLGIGLIMSILVGCAFGATRVSLPNIVKMVLNRLGVFHFPAVWRGVEETIIFQLRLPRVIGAALVGAALSTAGVLFQGLFRNPMADPYIIGTSAGAALGATLAMMLPVSVAVFGFSIVSLAAFIFALGAVTIVYNLARTAGKTTIVTLLLSGFVVSAFLTAIVSLTVSMSDRLGLNIRSVYAFLMGGLAISGWNQIHVAAPLIVGGISASWLFAGELNAFSLGEEGASYLGIHVEREKKLILGAGSLLTAVSVAIGGLIGFVGLIVPHAVRLTLGPDHRLLLPASALSGAVFLVICDILARSLMPPTEIPVGVLTAIIGAPFFIYLLRNAGKRYSF